MDNKIKNSNKIPGCETYTRPEEIEALSKYLGKIKDAQLDYISKKESVLVGDVYVPDIKDLSKDLERLVDSVSPGLSLSKETSKLPNYNNVELNNTSEKLEVDKINNLKKKLENLEVNSIELNQVREDLEVSKDKLNPIVEGLDVNSVELNGKVENLEVNDTKLNPDKVDLKVPETELNRKVENLEVNDTKLNPNKVDLEVSETELNRKVENLEVNDTKLNPDKLDLKVPETELNRKIENLEVDKVDSLGGEIENLNITQDFALKDYVDELNVPKDVDLSSEIIKLTGLKEDQLNSYREDLSIQNITELSKKLEELDGTQVNSLSANIEWLFNVESPALSSDFETLTVDKEVELSSEVVGLSNIEEISLDTVIDNLFIENPVKELPTKREDVVGIPEDKLNPAREDIKVPRDELNPTRVNIETPPTELNPVREDIKVPKDKLNPVREDITVLEDKLNPVRVNIETPKDKLNPVREDITVLEDKLNPVRVNIETPKDKLNPVREDITVLEDKLNPAKEDIKVPKDKLNPVREDIAVLDSSLNPKRENIPENKTPGPRDDEKRGTPTSIPTEIVDEAKKIKNVLHDGPEDIKLDLEGNLDGVHKSIREEDKRRGDDPDKNKEISEYIEIDDYSSPLNVYSEIEEDDLTSYISNNLEKSKYIKVDEEVAKPLNTYDEVDEDDLEYSKTNNPEKSKYIETDPFYKTPTNAYSDVDEDDLTNYIPGERSKYIKVDEEIAKPLNTYTKVDEDDLVNYNSNNPEKSKYIGVGEKSAPINLYDGTYVKTNYPIGGAVPENDPEHDTYFDPAASGAGLYEDNLKIDDYDPNNPEKSKYVEIDERVASPLSIYDVNVDEDSITTKTIKEEKGHNKSLTETTFAENKDDIEYKRKIEANKVSERIHKANLEAEKVYNSKFSESLLKDPGFEDLTPEELEQQEKFEKEGNGLLKGSKSRLIDKRFGLESGVSFSTWAENNDIDDVELEKLRVYPYDIDEKYKRLLDYLMRGASDKSNPNSEINKVFASLLSTYLLPTDRGDGKIDDIPEKRAEEFEAKLIKEAEAATLLKYQLPKVYWADINISSYIRYAAEKFVGVTKAKGSTRQMLLDETIATLIYLRNKAEKSTKTDRSRLPGAKILRLGGKLGSALTGPLTDSIITNLSQGSIRSAMSGAIGSITGAIRGSAWDQQQKTPVNYPQSKADEETRFDYPPEERSETYSEKWKKITEDVDNKGKFKGLKGAATKMFGGLVAKLKDKARAVANLNKTSEGTLWNYQYTNTDDGSKSIGTIETENFLMEDKLFDEKSLPQFFSKLEESKYFTSYTKFQKLTLDTNNYWEVRLEPYLNGDNGGLSFLPGFHEINIENKRRHGVDTYYNGWIPISGVDVQMGRLTTKPIQLFDGESFYPINYEMANELRLTIVDDIYKSWRRYFEMCMYVSLFPSLAHESNYYFEGEDDNGNTTKIAMHDKTNLTIAMYKNVTFRCRVLVMTPQLTASRIYDVLVVLKDFSEDFSGDTEGGGGDLNVTFSIVGEVQHEVIHSAPTLSFDDVSASLDNPTNFNVGKIKSFGDVMTDNINKAKEFAKLKHNNLITKGKLESMSKSLNNVNFIKNPFSF